MFYRKDTAPAMDLLVHIQKLQAIAQAGLAYSKDPYDLERFTTLHQMARNLLANVSTLEPATLDRIFFDETGYRTPKIDVRGAVVHEHKLLLVQETADRCWALPGGWAEVGEAPSRTIEREIFEESGLSTRATKIIAVQDLNTHQPQQFYHSYKIFFLCELLGGELRTSIETADARFFQMEALPPLSLERNSLAQVKMCYDHYLHLTKPTEFD